jgi:hypothetical protein
MRSRSSIALSNADRATLARWSACLIGALTALIAVTMLPVFKGHAHDGVSVRLVQSHAICAGLDRLASSHRVG